MRTYLNGIILGITLLAMAGFITFRCIKVIEHFKPPLTLVFESNIKVVQKTRRTCLKAGNTFVIAEAGDGWKIGCRI